MPFLQRAFGSVDLSGRDWLLSVAIASSVLWLRELDKAIFARWWDSRLRGQKAQ